MSKLDLEFLERARKRAWQALRVFPPQKRGVDQAREEAAELIVVINHWRRGRVAARNVIGEAVDVFLMSLQLMDFFGEETFMKIAEEKLGRLGLRIDSALKECSSCLGAGCTSCLPETIPSAGEVDVLRARLDQVLIGREEPSDEELERMFLDFADLTDVKTWRRVLYWRCVKDAAWRKSG